MYKRILSSLILSCFIPYSHIRVTLLSLSYLAPTYLILPYLIISHLILSYLILSYVTFSFFLVRALDQVACPLSWLSGYRLSVLGGRSWLAALGCWAASSLALKLLITCASIAGQDTPVCNCIDSARIARHHCATSHRCNYIAYARVAVTRTNHTIRWCTRTS